MKFIFTKDSSLCTSPVIYHTTIGVIKMNKKEFTQTIFCIIYHAASKPYIYTVQARWYLTCMQFVVVV